MGKGITVGMDVGDKKNRIYMLDAQGELLSRSSLTNTSQAIRKYFSKLEPCRVVLEAGTHSAWISRELTRLGHEVFVGNPRKLRAIWESDDKDDDRDAEMLARIGRLDPKLLSPIRHRGKEAQADLAVIKARDMLVKTRSTLIGHCRGAVKSVGQRISPCSAEAFHRRLEEQMPEELAVALEPVGKSIEELTRRIRHYDTVLERLSKERYSETQGLQEIHGVGLITALAFVLTLEESSRFEKSRSVGPFLGLTRKRDTSGETDKELPISKAGDECLRRLLVQCAQYILGHFGRDCELRRFGLRLEAHGGKNAKRRAVVAVARKLAVVMHRVWQTGEAYDPFYHANHKKQNKAA